MKKIELKKALWGTTESRNLIRKMLPFAILFSVLAALVYVVPVNLILSNAEEYKDFMSKYSALLMGGAFGGSMTSIISCYQKKGKWKGVLLVFFFILITGFLFPIVIGYSLKMGLISLGYVSIISSMAVLAQFVFLFPRILKKEHELKEQNMKGELALLKSQINPHFLFNTLNNIDSLIKSNPDKASMSLIELADMMRYMLHETNTNKVLLEKELNYIENYLKLQKMHHANQRLVSYTMSGNVEKKWIAPMVFISFIENAFKHCTDKDTENAIQFSFDIEDQTITFKASNLFDRTKEMSKDKSSGVGLDIVRRRLDLLYPNRHKLEIKEENGLFIVNLKINESD